MQKAAKAALGELSIQYWPTQIDKVIQLNSTLQVRHGVMLVGPAGGGKTTTRQILKRALVVLPTIQAREQQQPLGTGDYPEETGSLKTTMSFTVRMLTSKFACVERMHVTSRQSYWCSKTGTKPVLWEFNSFLR